MNIETAFKVWAASFLLSDREWEVGRRCQAGPLICVRYEFEWLGRLVKFDNFLALGCEPQKAVAAVQAFGPAKDHLLRVVADRPDLEQTYARLGYRVGFVEYLMARPLEGLVAAALPYLVRHARNSDDLLALSAIEGLEDSKMWPADLLNPIFRYYYVVVDGRPVARGRLARYDDAIAWISHVFTARPYRRRGIARSLMQHLLADGVAAGFRETVLLSTGEGHALYRQVGFQDLARVVSFVGV
ncbi:MAG: GNAT family N-acetyltransferase [Chloroflexi bacterium]|nr:GNAT family N-acetyltransferase [Chloroflexota bacterium]MCI0580622.1 GNAT family N-acetyltransferase [Chloroflexota bacterium]